MGLRYEDLTPETRRFMLEEIQRDETAETLYWAEVLREAAASGTDDTLAAQLRLRGRIVVRAQRRLPNSQQLTWYKLGANAPDVIACEFNVFYCRGLCRRAIAENIARLEVYRARMSAQPRRESEMKLGLMVEPEVILIDLRNTHGTEPTFGLPPGPNTGLSLRYPH